MFLNINFIHTLFPNQKALTMFFNGKVQVPFYVFSLCLRERMSLTYSGKMYASAGAQHII